MIEFPCPWPIKVIGYHSVEYQEEVLRVVREHATVLDDPPISLKASGKGNYTSLSISIEATGEVQLKSLITALQAMPLVKLVI